MSEIDDEVIILVKRLAKAIKKFGVKKVATAIDELNTEEGFIEAHQSLIKYLIKETSSSFQVNPEDMKKKNIRGTAVEARSMCFVLLKKHLDYSHQDIAVIFGRKNHSLVSSALREFKNLDYDIRQDRKILDIFKEVDKKVREQKDILWLKYS